MSHDAFAGSQDSVRNGTSACCALLCTGWLLGMYELFPDGSMIQSGLEA